VHGRQIVLRDIERLRNMAAGNGRENSAQA
jgi:hypothetical protein